MSSYYLGASEESCNNFIWWPVSRPIDNKQELDPKDWDEGQRGAKCVPVNNYSDIVVIQ